MKKVFVPFLLIVALTVFFLKGRIVHEKFNSNIWKTVNLNKEENWSLRWDMMNDLRNTYEIKGMNKSEIIDLLGQPETETDSEFSYYLGYSKKGINTGHMTIYFIENNMATSIRVWQG